MKIMFKSLISSVAILVIFSFTAHAQDACTKEDVVKAVEQAVQLLEAEGEAGLEKIGGITFCGNNYVFVNDLKGKTLMHAKKKLIGKVLIQLKDDQGKRFFADFGEVAKSSKKEENGVTYYNGSGWVDYRWPKPGEKTFSSKTSYIKGCRLGTDSVYVGAGIYTE